jgi:hypothetical protein
VSVSQRGFASMMPKPVRFTWKKTLDTVYDQRVDA